MDSSLAAPAGHVPGVIRPKRRHYRYRVHALTYVNLDQANGGVIREISEAGLAVQAAAPLRVDQQVHLRFELASPRTRVETSGRVVWADELGQAGVEFLELPPRAQRSLKDWVFTQLLARAHAAYGTDSVFIHHAPGESATQLVFSGPRRPALALAPAERAVPRERLRLFWCPIPISARSLARLLDGLILSSAVLLFSVVSLAMTHVFPTWPIGLGLGCTVAVVFAAMYHWLFGSWIGATPGAYLAGLAVGHEGEREREERPRFR
ncbi:MAG: PilZ domain-containing protein [Acidobacteriia bacterium]|nr:PilZ domain-containing protein [Terriglobia bacterium]